jgi:uncharacterized protein YrrD
MLKKYSEVLGLPVITANDGIKIGNLKDIVFRRDSKAVEAFILEKGFRTINGNVILLRDVLSLGNDAIIIDSPNCLLELRNFKKSYVMRQRAQLRGLRIYTQSGDDLGIVQDILFDYQTGRVEGVQVSDGWVQDIIQGRNILPFLGKIEIGEENLLVNNEAVEEMISSKGGLRNRL